MYTSIYIFFAFFSSLSANVDKMANNGRISAIIAWCFDGSKGTQTGKKIYVYINAITLQNPWFNESEKKKLNARD